MVVESAIHEAKGIAAKYRVFKRPRKDETRFQAGARRILEHTWLRFQVECDISKKEIPLLPSQTGQSEPGKFVRLKTVSEGDEKFELQEKHEEWLQTSLYRKRLEVLSRIRIEEALSRIRIEEEEEEEEEDEEVIAQQRRLLLSKLTVAELKVELTKKGLTKSGNKSLLIERLLSNERLEVLDQIRNEEEDE
jgi:hypothetical protein